MEALFQKNILEPEFPFRLLISDGVFSFPHHWHDEIEIVYVIEGSLRVGINSNIYTLHERDMIIISSGDIHYFLGHETFSKRVLIQFSLSIFDNLSSAVNERKFIRHLFNHSKRMSSDWDGQVHDEMEKQILWLVKEYNELKQGYKLALKARLYDLVVILLRNVPIEDVIGAEESKQREKLKRLESVFQYVENNFYQPITLKQIASMAGFSMFHFTRFFKECIGITFGEYLTNYRLTKAEWYLMNEETTITEAAYKSGFNSLKTFNRVFKLSKGCSPSTYLKKSKI